MDGEKDQQWLLPPSVKRGQIALDVWATLCATIFSGLTVMDATQKDRVDLGVYIVLMFVAAGVTLILLTTDGVSVEEGPRTGSTGSYIRLLFALLVLHICLGALGWWLLPEYQRYVLVIGNFVALFGTRLASRAVEKIARDGSLRREETSS